MKFSSSGARSQSGAAATASTTARTASGCFFFLQKKYYFQRHSIGERRKKELEFTAFHSSDAPFRWSGTRIMLNLSAWKSQKEEKGEKKRIERAEQPFDDSLYSGYSTYNNWVTTKVPTGPSLAKGFSAWGLNSPLAATAMAHHHNQSFNMNCMAAAAVGTSPVTSSSSLVTSLSSIVM